jgi:hypothetical protein
MSNTDWMRKLADDPGYTHPGLDPVAEAIAERLRAAGTGAANIAGRLGDLADTGGALLRGDPRFAVTPEIPGQRSEIDDWRQDQINHELAARSAGMAYHTTGYGTMGAALGRSGLGVGGGKVVTPAPPPAVMSAEDLAVAVASKWSPQVAAQAAAPALRQLDQARLAAAAARGKQAVSEANFRLGPEPTRQAFEAWALRPIGGGGKVVTPAPRAAPAAMAEVAAPSGTKLGPEPSPNAEKVMQQNAQSSRNDYGAWREELDRLKMPVNDNLIDILRKYGLAGAAPTGMGALASQSDYQE